MTTKKTTTKIPAAVKAYMKESERTAEQMREWILDQLEFFKKIDTRGRPTSEGYWIALKLGLDHERDGVAAVKWARGEA